MKRLRVYRIVLLAIFFAVGGHALMEKRFPAGNVTIEDLWSQSEWLSSISQSIDSRISKLRSDSSTPIASSTPVFSPEPVSAPERESPGSQAIVPIEGSQPAITGPREPQHREEPMRENSVRPKPRPMRIAANSLVLDSYSPEPHSSGLWAIDEKHQPESNQSKSRLKFTSNRPQRLATGSPVLDPYDPESYMPSFSEFNEPIPDFELRSLTGHSKPTPLPPLLSSELTQGFIDELSLEATDANALTYETDELEFIDRLVSANGEASLYGSNLIAGPTEIPFNATLIQKRSAIDGLSDQIPQPLLAGRTPVTMPLQTAIETALMHSPEIRLLRADVGIAQSEVTAQDATFDWGTFITTQWDDRNTPVGSELDGAQDRLKDNALNNRAGLQKQTRLGGSLDFGQDMNLTDSNSEFFDPRDQANSIVGLTFEQPLLRGGGETVATSQFQFALLDSVNSQADFVVGLQGHLSDVIDAYWTLAAQRGRLAVARDLINRVTKTNQMVVGRSDLDADPAQVARAGAAVASSRTALARAEYDVIIAQERLMRLIYGQYFDQHVATEFIPVSQLLTPAQPANADRQNSIAMQNRAEITRSLQEIRRASLEQGVAENQLLPALDLVLSMSNRGLAGDRDVVGAIDDQWDVNNLTYGVGLSYEMPIGNRAAKARYQQANFRLARFQAELERVIADVALDVRNTANELNLAIVELDLIRQEVTLIEQEWHTIQTRYELLIDGDAVGPLYLDNLLRSQERLADAQNRYLGGAATMQQVSFALQRANGLLLRETTGYPETAPVIVDVRNAHPGPELVTP